MAQESRQSVAPPGRTSAARNHSPGPVLQPERPVDGPLAGGASAPLAARQLAGEASGGSETGQSTRAFHVPSACFCQTTT
jgi:hypothetical protein